MEIVGTEGCICYNLSIDGESFQYLNEQEKRAVLHTIADKGETDRFYEMIMEYLHCLGEYKSLGTCDECGDSIDKYTLNL